MQGGFNKIIYDIGSNNGDIPYYLLKSDLVVAIEEILISQFTNQRFKNEIVKGKLIVENCVIQMRIRQ